MELYAHQQRLLDKNPERVMIVWQTGTGKTRMCLALAEKNDLAALIICPKALKTNWIEQAGPRHLVLTKEEFKKQWEDLDFFDMVIVDEAHYFFGMKSQMMKSLMKYLKKHKVVRRVFATATPYRSTPLDVYVMRGLIGSPINYRQFVWNFFYEVQMGMRTVKMPKAGMETELSKIVGEVSDVVKMQDCVDVPEQTFETEYVALTREQEIAIKNSVDVSPIVRYTRHHQICGGTLKGDEYEESKFFDSQKVDRLIDILKENPRAIVVCRYNNEIEYLMKKLEKSYDEFSKKTSTGKPAFFINGSVSGDERYSLVKRLQHEEEYVLFVNAACSEGWEVPECPLMIFYSYDFSLKNYVQMQGRILRINKLKKNTYLSLVVKGTIDEDIFKTVTIKKMDFHESIYSQQEENNS